MHRAAVVFQHDVDLGGAYEVSPVEVCVAAYCPPVAAEVVQPNRLKHDVRFFVLGKPVFNLNRQALFAQISVDFKPLVLVNSGRSNFKPLFHQGIYNSLFNAFSYFYSLANMSVVQHLFSYYFLKLSFYLRI